MHTKLASIILVVAILSPTYSYATEQKYRFCSIAGFYFGAKDDFLGGLALEKMLQETKSSDTLCSALYRDAYQAGEYMTKNGSLRNASDTETLNLANDFKSRIQKSILKNAGY